MQVISSLSSHIYIDTLFSRNTLSYSYCSQRWELMNTAVMTGRQVSEFMKVFMVSESGSVADVTLHTSCSSTDAAAIKVIKLLIWKKLPLISDKWSNLSHFTFLEDTLLQLRFSENSLIKCKWMSKLCKSVLKLETFKYGSKTLSHVLEKSFSVWNWILWFYWK